MTGFVEVNRLSVAFQSKTKTTVAVDAIDFELIPGETLALLGESGCGKSLTSLALMRLLPPNTVYGIESQIRLDHEDILEWPELDMRTIRGNRIAMIFQEPMSALNPVLTIRQQLEEALTQHQTVPRAARQALLIGLLKDVELPNPEETLLKYPHQLSGGQKQRALIAMALACKPQILIADEPTTALDVTIQAQILKLLKKLQSQYQMSLLLITHDLGVVKAMADRVCVMYAGRVLELAKSIDFFNQPLHPYAQQLFMSVPTFENRDKRLQAIPGNVPALDAMPAGCRFHPRCAHAFLTCDKISPPLQFLESKRQVACHLYPTHSVPPAIPVESDCLIAPEKSTEVLLSVRDLSVYFKSRTGVHAVDNLSFDLLRGQTLALVGESGCGKTTTARALIGLQAIHSGEFLYEGEAMLRGSGRLKKKFRNQIQIVFQDPYSSMNPRMSVGEIIVEGMQAQRMKSQVIAKRQVALLDQVGLPKGSLSRYPHEFSGGQRQRICIARALATDPTLLILDEPTSALDVSVQAQILNLLKALQAEHHLSFLFITHNMAVVAYMADSVLVMKEGKAVESGSCEQVLKEPAHEYTRMLLSSVPRFG